MDLGMAGRVEKKEMNKDERRYTEQCTIYPPHLEIHAFLADRPAKDHPALIAIEDGAVIAGPLGANPRWRPHMARLATAQPTEIRRQGLDVNAGPTTADGGEDQEPPGVIPHHGHTGSRGVSISASMLHQLSLLPYSHNSLRRTDVLFSS
jgi:hypothetical protein